MGEVYRAVDRRLGRSVALKVLPLQMALDDDRARRFIGEARAASALDHPNVAIIYDIGKMIVSASLQWSTSKGGRWRRESPSVR